jgi:hypothetical protein
MAGLTVITCVYLFITLTPISTYQLSTEFFVDVLIPVQKYFCARSVTFLYTDSLADRREFMFLAYSGCKHSNCAVFPSEVSGVF